MKAIIAKAIRQLLFVAGGFVGAKSTASDSDIEAISGAVMILGSLFWSWFNEYRKRKEDAKKAAQIGAALLAIGLMTGCGTVAPGSDPFVVRSEQTINNAVNAIDSFLEWEYEHPALSPPAVKEAAQSLRLRAPDAIRSAKRLVRAYKYNRTPENKATAETAIKILNQLITEVDAALQQTGLKAEIERAKPMRAEVGLAVAILAAIQAAAKLLDWAQKARENAARNKELTPEQEAEIDAEHEALFGKPHWKKRE